MDALVLLGAFTALCAIGMPVAYALGLAAIIAAAWIGLPLEAVMLKISDGTDDFALLAIPFFVLAGAIMAEGGMATRLVNLARVLVGFIRGGLALVNVLASTFFGAVSGSSVADTASIGTVEALIAPKEISTLSASAAVCVGKLTTDFPPCLASALKFLPVRVRLRTVSSFFTIGANE